MAIALAKKIDADIVMASDPDADRVGMACKDSNGEWVLVNGNQTCMIFLYYIIKNRIAMGKMKGNEFVVKTIVTTELIKAIADKNNVEERSHTDSWPKTSCATRMLCPLVRSWQKSVLGPKTRGRRCSMS